MLKWLSRFLKKPEPPNDPTEDAFPQSLLHVPIMMLATMTSEGLDASTVTQEKLLAEIRRELESLTTRDGFQSFRFDAKGDTCIPIFTSEQNLRRFCGEYSKRRNRVYPFQTLTLKQEMLPRFFQNLLREKAVVVVDPFSSGERLMTSEDRKSLSDAFAPRSAN